VRPLLHSFEPDLGWRAVVDGPVEIVRVAANHTTIVQPPHLAVVGRVIAERLERLR
jgi:thioesterase domain-containing protein